MTYKELTEKINALSSEQKNMDVTVYDYEQDEYFSGDFDITVSSNVLDADHPVITIKNCE